MKTLADVIDAIEANGIEKIKGEYIRYDNDNNPFAGCAMGQAAINLNVGQYETIDDDVEVYLYKPSHLSMLLHDAVFGFSNQVYELNDNTEFTLAEIAKELRAMYHERLDTKIRGL